LLENALLANGPKRVTRMPEHVGRGGGEAVDFSKRQEGAAKVPYMDDGMLAVIRGGQLGALVGALFLGGVVGPIGRPPLGCVDGVGGVQGPGRLLSAMGDGEVPDLDGTIDAGAEEVLAVGMPVNRGAHALVVGGDFLLWALVVAKVPTLDGAIVGAKGKLDGIGGRPLDVPDAAVDAGKLVAAAAGGDVAAHVAQVPHADGGIVAGGQQQVALVGVEGQLVDLAGVLVQARELDTGAVQVVEDDLAVGGGGGDVGGEVAVGPLDVMDAQAVALAGVGVGTVEDGGAEIDVVDDVGVVDADGLEDFLAGQDGMGALAVDVEGGEAEAGLVAGILGGGGADAAGGRSAENGGRQREATHPGSLGTRGLGSPSARLGGIEGGREPP